MKVLEFLRASGKLPAGVLASLLMAGLFTVRPLYAQQTDSKAALEKMKGVAETQHEIVLLLLKKKEYLKAATEAYKIFALEWPDDQEPLLLKELLYLSDQFLKQNQAPISLSLIDKHSGLFKRVSSRIAILKEKGYLYKSMNQDDEALECFREAQRLENE
jgi:tetratricopeptide (TPR) repeat protein